MKKYVFIIAFSLITSLSFSQKIPVTISGNLTNCPESELYLYHQTKKGNSPVDTIRINADGTFYLKATKFDTSQKMSIGHHSVLITDIECSAGDRITITGNAGNSGLLKQTLKISTERVAPITMDVIQIDKDGNTTPLKHGAENLSL